MGPENIQQISKMLVISFEELEEQGMMLFKEIERRKKGEHEWGTVKSFGQEQTKGG